MLVATYLVLLVSCCAYAAWAGGAPERWGVAILLASVALSATIPRSTLRFGHVELGFLLGDTLMLAAITLLALRAERFWPMYMAAVLVDTLVTHLLMLSPRVMPFSYSAMLAGWNLANPPILAIAAWRHQRRIAVFGSDPDWSISGDEGVAREHRTAGTSSDTR